MLLCYGILNNGVVATRLRSTNGHELHLKNPLLKLQNCHYNRHSFVSNWKVCNSHTRASPRERVI